jgi:hypothetical protein
MTGPPDDDPFAPPPEGTPPYPPSPDYLGPPPPSQRRFSVPAVVLGVLTPVLLLVVGVLLSAIAVAIFPVLLFGPLVAGAVLVGAGGNPQRRGFGLGLLIGWGALVVIAAGVCIALLRGTR